ncbi:MAG: hypothetical protein WCI63_04320 [bacterium]
MKITPQEIKNYELAARKYLAEYGVDGQDIILDHFGLQTLSSSEYLDLKNYFIERGKFEGEVVYHNRRLGIFLLGEEMDDKMELIEPHPGEVFWQIDCYVEHIAFRVKKLSSFFKLFEDRVLSTFNIDKTHGFEIQGPNQLLIEFRSNRL